MICKPSYNVNNLKVCIYLYWYRCWIISLTKYHFNNFLARTNSFGTQHSWNQAAWYCHLKVCSESVVSGVVHQVIWPEGRPPGALWEWPSRFWGWDKMTAICIRHFQMHCIEWKFWLLNEIPWNIFREIWLTKVVIGSNRSLIGAEQAIIWTLSDGLVYWRI